MRICQAMKISRNSYYAWKRRPVSQRVMEDKMLLEKIKIIHRKSRGIYGSPKIHLELNEQGMHCGHNRVARIMRENDIKSKIVKKYRHRGTAVNDAAAAPNLLNRQFNPSEKNIVWALDITYLRTLQGWVYLCICMDLYNKEIIGWEVSRHATADLAVNTMIKAIKNRTPDRGLIVHSDRGCQFGSHVFIDLLKRHHFQQSMSRKGNCWDNACVESFFGKLKTEHFNELTMKNLGDARHEVFNYIEGFYNRSRIHSGLKYLTPVEYLFNSLCAKKG